MVYTEEVAENLYLIDENLYSMPRWGSIYLLKEDKKALIDSGPTTSAVAILEGIHKLGIAFTEIDYLIVTHIHLDHAGGAGFLLKELPNATVMVHQRGARHLVNPEKLLKGVLAVQGAEAMAKFGGVVPISPERVKSIYGGEVLKLGDGQVLRFIDAPGHAPHELCIQESRNNGIFVGDAVGLFTGDDGATLLPVTPPPGFDLEQYISTLHKLIALDASQLYFAHFGASKRVRETLERAINILKAWESTVTETMEKEGLEAARRKLTARCAAELDPLKTTDSYRGLHEYLMGGTVPVNVEGFLQYYREKHGAPS